MNRRCRSEIVRKANGRCFQNRSFEKAVEGWDTYIDADRVLFEDLEQVLFDVLEDEIQAALSLERLLESDNVRVFEHAEHSNLAHDRLLRDLVIVRLLKFLYTDCEHANKGK